MIQKVFNTQGNLLNSTVYSITAYLAYNISLQHFQDLPLIKVIRYSIYRRSSIIFLPEADGRKSRNNVNPISLFILPFRDERWF